MELKIIPPALVKTDYEEHKFNRFSQCGEDGVIEFFLKKISVSNGYFVEFGAWDGKHLSNSAYLAEKGWAGCFIEGDSTKFQDLLHNYESNTRIRGVNRYVTADGENSLDNILDAIAAPPTLDVLSIDIDGNDFAVWKGLKRHHAQLVVVEYNPTIPANVVFVQDVDTDLNFGNSLSAFWQLGLTKGYELVASTDWNAFFISKNLCEKFNIPTYRPWEIKDTKFETYFFHGYNGEIKLAGNDSLVWHGIPFSIKDFQLLPPFLRQLPAGQSDTYYKALGEFKAQQLSSIKSNT